MTDEEVQESVARAEAEYEKLKDTVHDQYDKIQELEAGRKQMVKDLHKTRRDILGMNKLAIDLHSEICLKQQEINELNDIRFKAVKLINEKKALFTNDVVQTKVINDLLDILERRVYEENE